MEKFIGPMRPWPTLIDYGEFVKLTQSKATVFYYDSGQSDKPNLILIHGLGDDADTWRHLFIPLSERFRVIALDLPGFARSEKPSRIYSLSYLRDTVLEMMEMLNLGNADLMGNSLGAMIAEAIAIKYPDKITGLTLLDGTLTTPVFSYHHFLLLMALPFLGKRSYDDLRTKPKEAYENLRLFYANLDNLPEPDRQFLYQRVNERIWNEKQRDAFLSILHQLVWRLPFLRPYFAFRIAKLGIPIHVVWGEQDLVIPVKVAYRLTKLQPAAKLTVLPGIGHIPQQENPEAVMQAMLKR